MVNDNSYSPGGWRKGEELVRKLSIGDLLEFDRGFYKHWGVFIGDHDGTPSIVHLSTNDGDFDGAGNSSKKCSSKILRGSSATVRIDPFLKVAKDDKVRVNHFDYSCTPLPPAKIKKRALNKLGTGEYHLIHHNCEHFAKWCRYGDEARQRKKRDEKNQAEQVLETVLETARKALYVVGIGVVVVGGLIARSSFK